MDLGTLRWHLAADTSDLDRVERQFSGITDEAQGAGQAAERAGAKAGRATRGMEMFVGAVRKTDGALTRATRSLMSLQSMLVGLGAGYVITQTMRNFSEFERQLIEVGKTTDLQGENLQQLGRRIQEISREVPLSVDRLQSLAVAAGQLGVQGVDDVASFTETLGKLEVATDIVGEQGARSMARLLNITGESNSAIENLGSAITALGNNMATTEQEITQTATFLGASTSQFDTTAQEVIALSAGLRALGQRAETSGSAVGAAMMEIETALTEGGDAMQTLTRITGQTAEELRTNFQESATSVLLDFTEALGGLESSEVTAVLDEFNLAGRETSRVINAMAGDTEMIRRALSLANEEWSSVQALNVEAARAADSFSAQMRFLGNALNEAAVIAGREFAPIIVDIANDFTDMIQAAADSGELENFFENAADKAQVFLEKLEEIGRILLGIGGAVKGAGVGATVGRAGGIWGSGAGAIIGGTLGATAGYNAPEGMEMLWDAIYGGGPGGGRGNGSRSGPATSDDLVVTADTLWREDVMRQAGIGGPSDAGLRSAARRSANQSTFDSMGLGQPDIMPDIDLDKLETQMERVNERMDRMRRMSQDMGWSYSSAIEEMIFQTEKFSDILNQLFEDLARDIIRSQVTQPLGDYLGNQSGNIASNVGSWIGGLFNSGGRATGGTAYPGQTYEVNEQGRPEMLSVGNRDYLMMGSEGGQVSGAQGALGGEGDVIVNIYNQGGEQMEQERQESRRRSDGTREVDVLVKSSIERLDSRGQLDGVFNRHGARRQGTR